MSAPLDCPEMDCWQALFADALPPDQRERCERHLESCPVCQERLDRAEEGEAPAATGAQASATRPTAPADPTLSQVLERLHEAKSPLRQPRRSRPTCTSSGPPTGRASSALLGDYEVQEVIGQGGMGVVLKAYDPALHRLVAIKVLAAALAGSATARRRFTREAQAAAAVCHDHIVTVHGVHEADGLPYLVMQYVAGESLQDRLDRTGPLEVVEIVRIGLQTASGLAAAHAQGLIHRDIKPANLLLENGLARVKITDFGLARMVDDVRSDAERRGGRHAGVHGPGAGPRRAGRSPRRPVQPGQRPLRHVYRRPPFRGSTAVAVLRQVSDETPPPIRVAEPGRARLAGGDHRPADGEGPGRPLPERGRGGRPAGGLSRPPPPTGVDCRPGTAARAAGRPPEAGGA